MLHLDWPLIDAVEDALGLLERGMSDEATAGRRSRTGLNTPPLGASIAR